MYNKSITSLTGLLYTCYAGCIQNLNRNHAPHYAQIFKKQTNKTILFSCSFTSHFPPEHYEIQAPYLDDGSGMNVLGVVVFSVALGCVINHLEERGRPLMLFFEALNDATMVLIKLVIW